MAEGAIGGYFKRRVLAVQEFSDLMGNALRLAFTPPRYLTDLLYQMDAIGFGSLPIVLLTGFSMGSVLALQTYRTLVVHFDGTTWATVVSADSQASSDEVIGLAANPQGSALTLVGRAGPNGLIEQALMLERQGRSGQATALAQQAQQVQDAKGASVLTSSEVTGPLL